jgi:hypothetical protein
MQNGYWVPTAPAEGMPAIPSPPTPSNTRKMVRITLLSKTGSTDEISAANIDLPFAFHLLPNGKILFQSFFMSMTVQPHFGAASSAVLS